MFKPNQIITTTSDNKHNLFKIIEDTPKLNDLILTRDGIVGKLSSEEEVKLAITEKCYVLLPFISSIKQ